MTNPWRQDEEDEYRKRLLEEEVNEFWASYSIEYVSGLEGFARWLVSLDDDDPNSAGRQDRKTVTLTQIINRARLALED